VSSACLILALVVATPPAEDAVEQAKTLFKVASRAYEAGQYTLAIDAFEEAYQLAPRPAIAFSLAQSHRRQYTVDGDQRKLRRAIELYRNYVMESESGSARVMAEQHLRSLEPLLERLEQGARAVPEKSRTQLIVSSPTAGAIVRVDDGDAAELPAIFDVDAGKHKVTVEAPAHYEQTIETVAVAGRLVPVDVQLVEKPAGLRVHAPDGAEIAVDGRFLGTAPLPRAVEVSPGKHLLAVTDLGKNPYTEEIDLSRGQILERSVMLDTTTQRIVAYVFIGAGVLSLAASLGAGILALGAQDKAKKIDDKIDGMQSLTEAEARAFQDHLADRERFRIGGGILAFAGGVLAGTGVLLFYVDAPTPQTGARISVGGRF
jgi:hypothetical protein